MWLQALNIAQGKDLSVLVSYPQRIQDRRIVHGGKFPHSEVARERYNFKSIWVSTKMKGSFYQRIMSEKIKRIKGGFFTKRSS